MIKELSLIVVGALAWMSLCFAAVAADAPPAKRGKQAVQMGAKKEPAQQGETKPTPASGAKSHSRAHEDARGCLDLATYVSIIKCAEKYL
jgi:hypothetical protein